MPKNIDGPVTWGDPPVGEIPKMDWWGGVLITHLGENGPDALPWRAVRKIVARGLPSLPMEVYVKGYGGFRHGEEGWSFEPG